MNVLILEDSPTRIKQFRSGIPCATITETAEDCIAQLEKADEALDWLFLDHDLGGDIYVDCGEKNTGSEVVRWIVNNKPKINKVIVHSLNHEAVDMMVLDLTCAGYDVKAVPFIDLDLSIVY